MALGNKIDSIKYTIPLVVAPAYPFSKIRVLARSNVASSNSQSIRAGPDEPEWQAGQDGEPTRLGDTLQLDWLTDQEAERA